MHVILPQHAAVQRSPKTISTAPERPKDPCEKGNGVPTRVRFKNIERWHGERFCTPRVLRKHKRRDTLPEVAQLVTTYVCTEPIKPYLFIKAGLAPALAEIKILDLTNPYLSAGSYRHTCTNHRSFDGFLLLSAFSRLFRSPCNPCRSSRSSSILR